jgi:hypothetical protein
LEAGAAMKNKLYDIILCYCNGFVMIPQKVVHSNLTYEDAQSIIPTGNDRTVYSGESILMIAEQNTYELKNKRDNRTKL